MFDFEAVEISSMRDCAISKFACIMIDTMNGLIEFSIFLVFVPQLDLSSNTVKRGNLLLTWPGPTYKKEI